MFGLALQVAGILSAVRQLEPLGADTLKEWASGLSDRVMSLVLEESRVNFVRDVNAAGRLRNATCVDSR